MEGVVKDSKLYLVCLIASVITEPRRLRFFKSLLNSIRNQVVPLDGLFVSIYVAPELNEDMDALFQNINSACSNTHILWQKQKHKQFFQFKYLSDRLDAKFVCPSDKHLYLLFSDDDDLWHRERTYCYHMMINNTVGKPLNLVSALAVKETTSHSNRLCTLHHEDDVDEMVECGCVQFKFEHDQSKMQGMLTEYHEMAVRPFVLAEFLNQNAWLVKFNRFADMEFRYFVAGYKTGSYFTICCAPPHWLYFYRKCDSSYPAATQPVDVKPVVYLESDQAHFKTLISYALEMQECNSMARDGLKSMENLRSYCIGKKAKQMFDNMVETVKNERKKLIL